MTNQPYAPPIASKATLASGAVRSNITVALRGVADPGTTVTLPDDGPILVTTFGRTFQVTTTDITDKQ